MRDLIRYDDNIEDTEDPLSFYSTLYCMYVCTAHNTIIVSVTPATDEHQYICITHKNS